MCKEIENNLANKTDKDNDALPDEKKNFDVENLENVVSSDLIMLNKSGNDILIDDTKQYFGRAKNIKLNIIFNFISQILTLLLPLITAPYVARVLHEEGVGQISYAQSIITYFTLFANLGFDTYGQRQVARCQKDIDEKSKVFWEIFILRSTLSVVSLVILYSVLFSVGFGANYNKLILIISLSIIGVPLDISFLFRGDEDFLSLAVRSIAVKIVMIALIFIFVKDESDLWIYALCSTGVTVLSNFTLWPALFKRIKTVKIKELRLLKHLKPSFMIFLPYVAVTIYSVFDKTMIGLFAANPDYENGCYEQAYKINNMALTLVTVISLIMVSRNANDFAKGEIDKVKQHLYSACNYVFMMSMPLIVGFAVLSGNLSSWFLGEGYEKVPLLMQIMSVRFLASGLAVVFGDQLFIAIGKEKYSLIAVSTGAVVNIILNFILIPSYGALGAAIATAVCEITITFVFICFVIKSKWLSILQIIKNCWKYLIASAIMFVPIFFMQKYMGYSILIFIVITITGMAVYALSLIVLRDRFFLNNVKAVFSTLKRKFKLDQKRPIAAEGNKEDHIDVENRKNIEDNINE